MAKTFRLTDEEEKTLNEVQLKLNRELVKIGLKPLRDTEILHEILRQTLLKGTFEISRNGFMIIVKEAYKLHKADEAPEDYDKYEE
ncbi:hypothetical protein, partial [Acinetobacter oleivorans]|uniref:hypothetical protein n=1 Tax=Acinetobacter oleivorans TaxID=1148157 RepID=UPI00157FC82E